MKKEFMYKVFVATLLIVMLTPRSVTAQQPEVNLNVDMVSSFVWRGFFQGNDGPAIQPALSLSAGSFTIDAWGSTDFKSAKEIDLSVGYSAGPMSLTVTDYWWEGQYAAGYFNYTKNKTDHWIEASLGYDFQDALPLTLTWSTMLYGPDTNAGGKNMYSSYLEAVYSTTLYGVGLDMVVGVVPFKSDFYGCGRFAVTNIFVKGEKKLKLSDSFELPLFVQLIFNPSAQQSHLVAGFSF
ncbi:MAG: hypothetical protein PHH63_06520 [Bacteroidales bacterium]|nr:hypothetical protein [Bacteroidales bacterium]